MGSDTNCNDEFWASMQRQSHLESCENSEIYVNSTMLSCAVRPGSISLGVCFNPGPGPTVESHKVRVTEQHVDHILTSDRYCVGNKSETSKARAYRQCEQHECNRQMKEEQQDCTDRAKISYWPQADLELRRSLIIVSKNGRF